MTPRRIAALTGAAAVVCTLAVTAPAHAQTSSGAPNAGEVTRRSDDRPGPKTADQAKKRAKALALLKNGKAQLKPQEGGGATVALSSRKGDVVEFPVDKSDKIFTVLSEFGTQGSGRLGTDPGPLHNQLPQPDRTKDNSTYWVPDFNKAHYEAMFNGSGESFADYYSKLSSGKYTAINTVSDWVQVPGNASTYGDNAVEDTGGSWAFVNDSIDAWYAKELASGKSAADIDAYLSQFDVWDRYDFDGDGNFNEADGYLDHFQAVHAGGGEEAGAGEDAIWSHRWYVNPTDYGTTGPTVDGTQNLYGGAQIGGSKYFVGDYTVEPEDGGLGVFTHEFGHDLGLPDYYDTAGGENGTAFWTLMSSGSWLGHGKDSIGTTPGLMGPEEKLFLGWLDYTQVNAGQSGSYTLSPSQDAAAKGYQAIKVNLPNSSRTDTYVTPPEGTHAWWSGRGDDLKNTLTRTVPAGSSVTVSADLWYAIEANYDHLYAEYSTDGGATWTQVGQPLTGSGTKWASKKWSYRPADSTKPTLFQFRYATDGGVNEAGAFLDNISVKVGQTSVLTDGAEAGDNGWTVKGWKVSTGTEVTNAERYYLLENRQYVGYDQTLAEGPYQFSEAYTRPDWVEHFKFQNGMLVWMVDQGYSDNNVSQHPGVGYALPVDVRPNSLTYPDGTSPSNRREPFDATFGLEATDATCLHKQVPVTVKGTTTIETLAACAPSVAGVPRFDDTNPLAYYDAAAPQNSVKVAGVGVKATVTDDTGGVLTVNVTNPAP
ncbi:MAG TPA: immune inhibitor A domain-containing protein [Ornithinibacter sp.]|nr:immune inhibitor A domain-containing protein [Ornithinibacter sp.]